MIIIGTTDTDYKADPAEVKTEEEDVRYLLKIVNEYFPKARLTEQDVVASYSGVRPLVHDGSRTESGTSREHMIESDPRGVTFVAGGKYTTYRAMAEDCIHEALSFRSVEDQVKFGRSQTREPLNPAATPILFQQKDIYVDKWVESHGISLMAAHLLFERHGLEGEKLIERMKARKSLNHRKSENTCLWEAEVDYAIDNTMCLGLLDFYLRRSPLFLSEEDHGFGLMENLAQVFVERLGWSDDEKNRQFNALQKHLEFEMGWRHPS
jgi:glycerol-3-phosphate dehydrogenase